MTVYPASRIPIDPNGNVDLVIQGYRFLVSASRMSAISPKFGQIFNDPDHLSQRTVELPSEDPVAFRFICLSAHGHFVPQSYVSLEVVVKIADAVRRYNIPSTSSIYEVVRFYFDARTERMTNISTSDLTMLLQVARILGPTVLVQFLKDVFYRCPFSFEPLPIEPTLSHLKLKGAALRLDVAYILLRSMAESAHAQQEMYGLATMIIFKGLSLYEISSRLDQAIGNQPGYRRQLQDALDAIERANAEISFYSRSEAKLGTANGRDITQRGLLEWQSPEVSWLDIQIASEERTAYPISPSHTEFEDIEVYSRSVDEYDETRYDNTIPITRREGALRIRRNTA
ncbi:hypothetical protein PtrSN002B_009929 [Pyrenophora tritici-repentis]|uniref:Uncharacterized protein n=2 Tax=Pyrenophora tritici-repentis TaxID=45151 RepID=A0A2W1HF95_9PLEO|nr:uncharacterized protein PTRG_04885 [Pyrenophora tritici-repentis Pt-1C-BFP]KAA8611986.1 hypothetical protein PtrV1_13862 [Pyrenophora tritici-repentis]EDU47792.1 predicted protein [Pyrenophora tritici-repentis Pt-1C-BFP]KAF7569447.1 hypothetical protein PtrM4_118620 [Pyrenophora tritici-repentis]KAG9382789.1 hypothetical protein A1F94_006710 [Pyrenophora tritici-repentis]KAI0580086.1 hypothetical protein Alg215_05418 [Pyrenophora tritici-repentis]